MNLKKKKTCRFIFFFFEILFRGFSERLRWKSESQPFEHKHFFSEHWLLLCFVFLVFSCSYPLVLVATVFFFFFSSVFHKLTGSFSSPQTNTRDDSVSFLLKIIFRGIVCRRAVSCWHISLSPLCRATSQPMVFSEQPIPFFSPFLFFFLFLSYSETSFIVVDLPLRYKKAGKACFSFFLWLSRPLRLYFSISESLRFTAFSDFHLISERL